MNCIDEISTAYLIDCIYEVSTIMNLAPSIGNHIVAFAQSLIISIPEQCRQLVLLAGITIKLLRTFYIAIAGF